MGECPIPPPPAATTRVQLLCHASTEAVRDAAFPADESLDARARRKLEAFAPKLSHADTYWTSPAVRAVQTAEALGLAAIAEPRLRDCDYGAWSGRSLLDIQAQDPEGLTAWLSDPDAAPHGGESLVALIARVAAWLDGLAASPARIVAVTHASVIRAAVLHAIEAPPRSFWRIDVAPLTLTRLSHNRRWTLSSVGATQAAEP